MHIHGFFTKLTQHSGMTFPAIAKSEIKADYSSLGTERKQHSIYKVEGTNP
ncbi:hypothetical protein D3C74_492700 [compost metagenome]